jgi:hypothetical protein
MRDSIIRKGSDLRAIKGDRPLPVSPGAFDGTLSEFYAKYGVATLPAVEAVVTFHHILSDYVTSVDPLFLVRAIGATERGETYTTADGSRLRATDNAPAWWTQAAMFRGARIERSHAAVVFSTLPTHLFHTSGTIGQTCSDRGWHVAHIFDVKDGNTEWPRWKRRELVRRFVRAVHPCNYFLLPKTEWHHWGGDKRVIAFYAGMYAERYAAIWNSFLDLAEARMEELARVELEVRYAYGAGRPVPHSPSQDSVGQSASVTAYTASRLLFKADVIDGLQDREAFRIETPVGVFQMTKAEFMAAFPKVVLTKSYLEKRVYHFPKVPHAAERFRIG